MGEVGEGVALTGCSGCFRASKNVSLERLQTRGDAAALGGNGEARSMSTTVVAQLGGCDGERGGKDCRVGMAA